MLAHPTLDQLNALGLYGLAKGFKELEHKAEVRGLDHAEWLGLPLEYELTLRRQKQFETRARVARLRHPASVEDVNYQIPRGLDRALFLKLAACDWIAERRNLLLTGVSGLGKSWLAWRAPPRRVPRKHARSLHPRPQTLRRSGHRLWDVGCVRCAVGQLRTADGRSRRIADVADCVLGRLNWAASTPARVASGRTGVRAIAAIPL